MHFCLKSLKFTSPFRKLHRGQHDTQLFTLYSYFIEFE